MILHRVFPNLHSRFIIKTIRYSQNRAKTQNNNYWKRKNGDPQKEEIDYVNWIELIRFKETRNYVQRVLENVNVYKYLLAKKPLKIRNYFVDKPHY